MTTAKCARCAAGAVGAQSQPVTSKCTEIVYSRGSRRISTKIRSPAPQEIGASEQPAAGGRAGSRWAPRRGWRGLRAGGDAGWRAGALRCSCLPEGAIPGGVGEGLQENSQGNREAKASVGRGDVLLVPPRELSQPAHPGGRGEAGAPPIHPTSPLCFSSPSYPTL